MALGIGAGNSLSFIGGGGAPPPPPSPDFISTWDTTKAGSASNTVVLPLINGGASAYSGTIDWGDGSTSVLSYANRTHVYATTGIKTITISGQVEGWRFAGGGDRLKLLDVVNWGTLVIRADQAFSGCENMTITAIDAPTFNTTSVFRMFRYCNSLVNPDLSAWTFPAILTKFDSMFVNCPNLNTDSMSGWDMQYATNIRQMFWGTGGMDRAFNGDITNWNVSNVTAFDWLFGGDYSSSNASFNRDIGGWNTSSALNMSLMFRYATSFDQDLSGWDINQVTNLLDFMNNVTLSTVNYDALLIAWDAQGAMSYSGTVNFGTSQYTSGGAAEAARTSLISKWGGITDGGAA